MRRCVFLTACLVLLGSLLAGRPAHAQSGEISLDRALVLLSDSPADPDFAAAAPVSLPDEWLLSRGPGPATVWYRVPFESGALPTGDDVLAVYAEHGCGEVELRLNGQRLRGPHPDAGRAWAPPCYRPLLASLPPAMLKPGTNVLDLKITGLTATDVASRYRAGQLSTVLLGPARALEWRWITQRFWQLMLPSLVGAALLTGGLAVTLVGWLNTRKTYLLYYGLLSAGWAALTLRTWRPGLELAPEVVEWGICALVPVVAACAVVFLMRYAGLRSRPLDAALAAQCLIVPASLALAGSHRLFVLANSWFLLLMLEVLLAALAALTMAWRVRRREFWVLLGPLALIAWVLANELAWQQRWVSEPSPAWLSLMMPLAFLTLGLRMLYVEMHSLRLADAEIRALVERRVAESTAEAERNFSAMAELRVEQVTERERKRIAADLHDDLGAKLLTIVHTSESDRISTLAREALEEMRLSVRGLTGRPVRLIDALGDWRAEVVSRLGQANIGADWQGPAEELPQTLPARTYVQTTRIVREAVSNIIKHSGAARCAFACRVQDGDFVLTIQDNGRGIPMELDGKLDRGHGMASMKSRAKQLQGQCLVESGPGYGTVIRLTIPLGD